MIYDTNYHLFSLENYQISTGVRLYHPRFSSHSSMEMVE